MNEKDRKKIRSNVECIMRDMADLKKRATAEVAKMYPDGSRVEVRLKHGQHNLTTATVVGWCVHGGDYGPSYYPKVVVEIDTAKPRSRLRYREVTLDNIRPIGVEK